MKFTIVVVTYNFENIILECLESIEKQTYKNFDVIITDDASIDNTLYICKKWKEKMEGKIDIKILSNSINQGVVKNLNRGVKVATGEWIKIIAGDDKLIPDTLEKYNNFIEENQEARIILGKVQSFSENKLLDILPKNIEFYKKKPKEQFYELLEENKIAAPSSIIKRELLEEMEYFDESFKMVEDYPFWLKVLKNNIKIYFLDDVLVMYRRSSTSVSALSEGKYLNKLMLEYEKDFYNKIYKKEVKNPLKIWNKYIELVLKNVLAKNKGKKNIQYKIIKYLKPKKVIKYTIILLLCLLYKFII